MIKLKIAMLTTFYPPFSFGGDAIGVERLVTAMAKHGHQITVIHDIDAFTTLSDLKPTAKTPPENVEVIGLKSSIGFISKLLTQQLGRPVIHHNQLQEILKAGDFDVIWFNNPSLIGGPALLSYGEGVKIYEAHEHWLVCPTHVLWRHNKEVCESRQCLRCSISYRRPPQIWRHLPFFHKQLDHIDAFIAKSEFSKNKHKEFGFPKEMQVVPYFLPEKQASHDENVVSPHDRPYFLFVGRLEKIKGLDDVIPVFEKYPQADLLIIGAGEYENNLKKLAVDIPNVKFVGRLPPEELSRYYESAISLIVPSVCYETFGIILIESFREGTPVIARELGPFGEIISRCDGGLLFSDNDGLLVAMNKLQEDPSYRLKMAQSAKAGFDSYWNEKAVLKQYYRTVYQAALEKGNKHVASALEKEI